MEIKVTLNKPYTDTQRLNFIVLYNHQHGYEIKETETALEAWGPTAEEIAQRDKDALIAQKKEELAQIDLESILPTRAIQNGTATEFDTQKVAELEERAEQVRQEIRDLCEVKLDKEEEFD